MKLISILLFGSLIIQSLSANLYYITKFGSYYSYGNNNIFYFDLSSYKDIDYLYFRATVYYGYFGSGYLNYDYSNSKSNPSVSLSQYYDYSSYSSYYSTYYYKYSYNWSVKKPSSYSYFFVAHPNYYCAAGYGSSWCYVLFENLSGFGLSLGAIIGICAAAVVIIAVSIIVTYFVRRARRASYISPPVAVYTPPVAPAYPPPTYY